MFPPDLIPSCLARVKGSIFIGSFGLVEGGTRVIVVNVFEYRNFVNVTILLRGCQANVSASQLERLA